MAQPSKPAHASLRKKSSARLAAVQCLYQISLNAADAEKTLSEFTQQLEEGIRTGDKMLAPFDPPHRGLMADIVRGVYANQNGIDKIIAENLRENWKMERMSPLLLSILRASLYELQSTAKLNPKIIIDEYVTLTKGFFSDAEVDFVNAFLNIVAVSHNH